MLFQMSPNGQIHARLLFNSREQGPTESLDEFLNGLCSLSSKCQYEASSTFVQHLVRDRFVAGIRNKNLQAVLVKCSDLTSPDSALAIAKSESLAIKQEDDENEEQLLPLSSIHDKLQVQVNEIQPDVIVTEETKIAILIELMNHKSILTAPSGHENEKAQLWSKIYRSLGNSFKSALHLREVFVTWKTLALQLRQQDSQEDIKVSNADKLIWDLFGHEDVAQLEDYPTMHTGNSTNHDELIDDDDGNDELYTYEENDLESSESHDDEEDSEGEEVIRPVRRGRGRPRKESLVRATSTSISNETKILVLRRLVLQKNILNAKGNEKNKKDMWKSLFNAFSKELSLDSPSALRGAFRIWKQRSMKKRDNPEETITEADKLIFQIFSLDYPATNSVDCKASNNDQDLEDALEFDDGSKEDQCNFGLISLDQKIKILQEISKFRDNIGVSVSNVYEKESAWRAVHQKIKTIEGLNNLSLKMLKELTKFWQAKAFHQSINRGGPKTQVEKLMYYIYFINKNAAAPFANMPNGQPPPLQQEIPGCTLLSPDTKLLILKEMLRSKSDLNQEETWEKLCTLAGGWSLRKLRFLIKQWKTRAVKLNESGVDSKSKSDQLVNEIYDLKADGGLRDVSFAGEHVYDDLSEEAKLLVANRVADQPWILFRCTNEKSRVIFWQSVIEELHRMHPNTINHVISIDRLEKSFWKWKDSGDSPSEKMAREVVDHTNGAESIINELTNQAQVAIINELYQNQEYFLLGTFNELNTLLWERIRQTLTKLGVVFRSKSQLAAAFTILKIRVRNRLASNCHNTLSNHEKMILQVCIGGSSNTNFGMTEELSKSAKEIIVPLISAQSEVLKHGDMQSKLAIWSDIHLKSSHVHNVRDALSLVKLIRNWRLILLEKDELDGLETSLTTSLGCHSTDFLDSELLTLYEDSSAFDNQIAHIFIPDFAKGVLTNIVMNKRDRVLCGLARDLPNVWWEILGELQNSCTVKCAQSAVLHRAFFVWTFEAWKKRLQNSVCLSPYEITMLDLACAIKSSENLFNGDLQNMSDLSDIPENIMEDIMADTSRFKELMQTDKALFWSLVHKVGQAHCMTCDNPQKLYFSFLARCINSQQKMEQNIPLTSFEIGLLDFFGSKSENLDEEEEGDEVIYEAETMWDLLSENITEKSRMAILDVLHQHSNIVAKRKRGLGDPQVVCDRIAIWQKALNVAIEEGVKIENHSKLMRMVRDWREAAKRNQSDGKCLQDWERKLLEIFEEQPIKEEAPDDEYLTNIENNAGFIIVPEPIRLVIVKAMLRHKSLLFSGKDTHQESGWRKVYRIAQANGAFYDSINSMRVSIGQWKLKALAKLSKDPKSICELDKLIYQIYDVDTGELDCEIIKAPDSDAATIKLELPMSRLTTAGLLAILEEMFRLKGMLIEKQAGSSNEISHKDRFYAWQSVFQVANAVGGNFSSILQLSTFIQQELKWPALKKIQLNDKINVVDQLLTKVYDFEHNCQLEEEFNIDNHHQQSCRLCQISFGRFEELVLHQQVVHAQQQPNLAGKCLTCGYDVGVGKAALRVHQRSKHSQEIFACDFCDQSFITDEDFYHHVRDHISYNPLETLEQVGNDSDDDKDDIYGFGKQAKRRGLYRKRVKVEIQPPVTDDIPRIGKKEGGLCPHCGEVSFPFQRRQFSLHNNLISFQYYKHVQQHIMYKHETKKPWKCDQCNYAHALQKGLQEHVRNCHPKESDLKVCHICGYKTTLNHNLKEHIERTHEKKRRFTCNLCDAHFYRKNVMERHVRGKLLQCL